MSVDEAMQADEVRLIALGCAGLQRSAMAALAAAGAAVRGVGALLLAPACGQQGAPGSAAQDAAAPVLCPLASLSLPSSTPPPLPLPATRS